VNDESTHPEPPVDQTTEGQQEASKQPAIDVTQLPTLPAHPRSQRMPGTNIGRWATFGCVAAMLMLVVLLVIGVHLTKRTVWMAYARAQQRILDSAPAETSSGERMRTERNLQRFRARLDTEPDPMPLMGRFLGHVTEAFEDDRITADELDNLNDFMEGVLSGLGDDPP
jgi:hypothetical protein